MKEVKEELTEQTLGLNEKLHDLKDQLIILEDEASHWGIGARGQSSSVSMALEDRYSRESQGRKSKKKK